MTGVLQSRGCPHVFERYDIIERPAGEILQIPVKVARRDVAWTNHSRDLTAFNTGFQIALLPCSLPRRRPGCIGL